MWKDWTPEQIAERHKLIDKCLHCDPVLRDIHRLYQILDGKSAALFSHVSIMIAACTFLAGSLTDSLMFEKMVFLVSTAIYLCIAIRLLRVLDFNMYDLKIDVPEMPLFLTRQAGDMYDSETDAVFGDLRVFFARGVKARGIAHKSALKWTRRLTTLVVILVIGDILLRAYLYLPQPALQWLRIGLGS